MDDVLVLKNNEKDYFWTLLICLIPVSEWQYARLSFNKLYLFEIKTLKIIWN